MPRSVQCFGTGKKIIRHIDLSSAGTSCKAEVVDHVVIAVHPGDECFPSASVWKHSPCPSILQILAKPLGWDVIAILFALVASPRRSAGYATLALRNGAGLLSPLPALQAAETRVAATRAAPPPSYPLRIHSERTPDFRGCDEFVAQNPVWNPACGNLCFALDPFGPGPLTVCAP